jgi:hypothetical protein
MSVVKKTQTNLKKKEVKMFKKKEFHNEKYEQFMIKLIILMYCTNPTIEQFHGNYICEAYLWKFGLLSKDI